ncbi:MAG: hypothetical protein VX768_15250 [Planctomycetota bacterium]|nr:hypothetical protein [Planctomycetota bacterium]
MALWLENVTVAGTGDPKDLLCGLPAGDESIRAARVATSRNRPLAGIDYLKGSPFKATA